jgi:hypothetical protein
MRFHELILQASGSRRLQAITRSLIELPLVTIKQHAWPGEVRIRRTNEQHWDLIEALRARDPLLGRLRAQAHILSARPRAMLHLALSAADLASPAVDFVVALRMLPVQIALPVLAHHDGWRGVCGLEREQQI